MFVHSAKRSRRRALRHRAADSRAAAIQASCRWNWARLGRPPYYSRRQIPPCHASSRDTAEFAFDYSTVGVPAAPNSNGTTLGLPLRANRPLDTGALSGVSVSPNGQAFTGNYVLEFDLWENFPGPAPGGGAGSTQLTGAGIMTSGAVPHYAGSGDGLWFAATGEGGSSIDYRAYFGGANQATASLYPAGGQNQTAAYYQTNFPGGVAAPAAQVALYPVQTGTTGAGTIGWAWHHVKITKTENIVTWDIDAVRV